MSGTNPGQPFLQIPETAVLDANVIFGGGLRDFLLSTAFRSAFVPAWSDELHNEWMRNRVRVYGDDQTSLEWTRGEMEKAFPGANMEADQEKLDEILSLCRTDAERKDAHVIMTAVVAEATTIVTFNTRDFPVRILDKYSLRREKPDVFCNRILPSRLDQFIAGARHQRIRLRAPERDPADYLRHLADAMEMPMTAGLLRPHLARL